ncbi:MAG TPA: cystathionine beta-lyase [Rhodospirillaceae bacterium]|mgnify:CR=1 FL=1|jgi:cystathionine beta-lyase|nr:cystathionine beta-lyase [Alphaproteobacteria bacterium]HBH25788.1 cystathionine beta-lyase [Rhodospirillaceae bacterium]
MTDLHTHTRLVHLGRDPAAHQGAVNPPIVRTSTFIYAGLEAYRAAAQDPDYKYRYGRLGNPLSCAFEGAMAELDGGAGAVVAASGLAACVLPFLAYARAGGHMLVTDSVYLPIRAFAAGFLRRAGVEVEYYDPCIGAGIGDLIRDNTCLIYMESPGFGTFEVQDVPAIVAAARARGVPTAIDNTWAGPLLFRPLEHGVDVAVQAATKYIGGHADVNLGAAVAREEATYRLLKATAVDLGYNAGAEDLYLALRGLRTLPLRLRESGAAALQVAQWLEGRAEVARVLCPALPPDPGHALWRRDFTGAAGVFSFFLKPLPDKALVAFVDALALFPVGSSWGGYESLLQPQDLSARQWRLPETGPLLRLQIGLEDPADLIEDLERGFAALARAR